LMKKIPSLPNNEPTLNEPIENTSSFRDWLASAFGISPRDREEVVRGMLFQHAKGTVSYWFQLILAMGIATLGLVLNSTGVVIGAMLIAPLMGPIIGVGMGLAIGSPYLFVKSLIRCLVSIVCVVGGAAILVLMLPFHEITTEIAARTSPTLLDLFVAIFCALAAAFTTVQRASEVASTAAGTSIGISLVPPLCVVGFGLGIGQYEIAGGAALLFTANLCAILLFTALMFVVLGLDTVDALALEDSTLDKSIAAARVSGGLRKLFGWRHGVWLRVLLPALFIAAIYAPLRQALEEVSWQVRVRGQIKQVIEDLTDNDAVTTTLSIERRSIVIRMVLVEQIEKTKHIEEELLTQIKTLSGVVPTVEITTVPNEEALKKVAMAVEKTAQEARIPPKPDLKVLQKLLSASLQKNWPEEAAGKIVSWRLSWDSEVSTLVIAHLGPPIGDAAKILLSQTLSVEFTSSLKIEEAAIDTSVQSAAEASADWIPSLVLALEHAQNYPALSACVLVPEKPVSQPTTEPLTNQPKFTTSVALVPSSEPAQGEAIVRAMCTTARCQLREQGERFSVQVSLSGCAEPSSTPTSSSNPAKL
jgi:uncharacterized hydrophobic protein (TIGR00271 family)